MKNKKGFTLIELLAVIVILAIIALIATPLILGVINDSRRDSLKTSAYGILSVAELEVAKNMNNLENYSTSFGTSRTGTEPVLSFKGKEPKSGKVFVGKDGSEQIVISDGTWCAYKYDNKNDVKVVKNGAKENGELICDEEKISETETIDYSKCFNYTEKSNGTIRLDGSSEDYSCFKEIPGVGNENQYTLIIPKTIKGKKVDEIADAAFGYSTTKFIGNLTIPDTIVKVGNDAFAESRFSGKLILGKNLKYIGNNAFLYFYHSTDGELVLPVSIETISSGAFSQNSNLNGIFIEYSSVSGIQCRRFDDQFPDIFLNTRDKDDNNITLTNVTCRAKD